MKTEEKLQQLRELMKERKIDAYIIPTDDFHSSEYVGEYFKERAYLSGFTGSAGTLVVMEEEAALWTDGRYFLQAGEQLKDSTITLMKMGQPGVPTIAEYLAQNLPTQGVIGFDGRTVTARFVEELERKAKVKKPAFYGKEDLVDLIWKERPAISKKPVWELEVTYAGLSREKKMAAVREKMKEAGADYLLLTALDEIAWLLNLRGDDVKNTPVFLSYMVVGMDKAVLCVHEEILSAPIKEKLLAAGVEIEDYEQVDGLITKIAEGKTVWADKGRVSERLIHCIPEGVGQIDSASPLELMKAIKTPEEMRYMREAHRKDGVAVTRFLYWLKKQVTTKEGVTELEAAAKLEEFRAMQEGYLGASFDPIIAYGAHGAIVHYDPTPETDIPMQPSSFCLADTGGHYKEGTTDITRTIALGTLTEEEKRAYTIVLRGHLNLGAAKFLHGVCGQNLDCLAREPLWENGLDYNHGTGHGVGYILSVHEGPQNFRWRMGSNVPYIPLEEGMIISNEPGLYLTGKFGIRHENLVLCRKGEQNEYGQFMYLEPLTLVPFDLEAIEPSLMTDREVELLNAYHEKVREAITPYLEGEEKEWLIQATRPISK